MPDPDSLGGPAACEPPFVAELRRRGIAVTEEIYVYGDKLSRTSPTSRIRRVLAAARRLKRKIRDGNIDLVHLNSSFDRRALLRDVVTLAVLGRRIRVFIKFHGSDADLLKTHHPFFRRVVHKVLNRVDGIGLLSSEEKRNFVAAGWPAEKIFVVKNVVERTFPDRDANFNQRYGLGNDLPTLLFIGRFIPAKGLLDVIKACGLLRDQGTGVAVMCVGDGPARIEAEAEVKALALEDRVRFVGFFPESETAEFYANCSILVFPTYHYEGFPMTVFYAVAAGLPVVTTRIRGAADYLQEPDNCLWVEPKNPKMIAEKIAMLLREPERRKQMGDASRTLAGAFDAEAVAPEYLEAYRKIATRLIDYS